jgi:hypothetical protein
MVWYGGCFCFPLGFGFTFTFVFTLDKAAMQCSYSGQIETVYTHVEHIRVNYAFIR